MPRDAKTRLSRRRVLAQLLTGAGAALLAGCEAASRSPWFSQLLGVGEQVTRGAQRLVTSRRSMAQEFDEADLSPEFRSNGTSNPKSAAYQAHASTAFADWALQVDGLVASPAAYRFSQGLLTVDQALTRFLLVALACTAVSTLVRAVWPMVAGPAPEPVPVVAEGAAVSPQQE